MPATERRQTRGEYLVGVAFNPSGLAEVDDIKDAGAALIDAICRVPTGSDFAPDREAMIGEARRNAMAAVMWGVKAATLKQPGDE